MRVTIYTKPGCHLCEDALDVLDRLAPHYELQVQEVNILGDPALYEAYHEKIPVVQIEDGRLGTLEAPIDEASLRTAFEVARRATDGGKPNSQSVVRRPSGISRTDRLALHIGRHWLRYATGAMAVFVLLPWLAAILAWLGWWGIADPIYTAYAFTCHQLPERAGSVFGYQVAFCYRNTALYGGVALFGMMYGLARDNNVSWLGWMKKPVPWWILVFFLLPVAVDGFSHMLGLRDVMMDATSTSSSLDPTFGAFFVGSQAFSFNWWLRISTGLLAALGLVWFAFPRMERAMEESEALWHSYHRSVAT
jgi:uncharacterized membrane protein/glutaredoxin